MPKTDTMDLIAACQSFPRLFGPQIERENILDAIDMTFAGEAQVLIIEGPEGMGKTTLLAQFAKRYPNRTISLFIKPTSHWAYDPGLLKYDLCNQMHWALYREELRSLEIITDDRLRDYIAALRGKARWGDFYFVVDGLHDIPQENEQVCEIILDMLPWGLPGFRFLFSGETNRFSPQRMHHISSKTSQLPPFSTDETKRYLSNLDIEKQLVEKIHKAYKGIPSKLASVRRILMSESQKFPDAQTLLEDTPGVFDNPYQIEWRSVKMNNTQQITLLAIVAHEIREHTSTDLSRIMDVTVEVVAELTRDLNFIFLDPEDDKVSFVSEEFRKFAAIQLRHLKETVSDLLINDLLRDPEGDNALIYLPEYLQQAGKAEELIDYLSPERFTKIVEKAQSLSIVRQKADLGVHAALELKRDNDLFRFTLQESLISEIDAAEVWRSEIEARMALGDYKSALALAQRTVLKEDRLHLLAIIAKVKLEHNLTPELELMEQIKQLYDQIDHAALGARAIDIAADLFYSNRKLAIDLIEKVTAIDADESALDWAFARLFLTASKASKEKDQPDDTVDDIRSRIKDPRARSFSSTASLALGKYSAKGIIAEVEKLDGAIEKMFLLRHWTLENQRREDSYDVINFALQLAIKTTRHAFNARDYREIASPLPFIRDASKARYLVSILDSQKSTIEHIGPTEDYVRLQLLLVHTESNNDFEAARNRIIDTYLYIDDLKDLAIKTNCIARLVALLQDIDPQCLLDKTDQLHSYVYNDLQSYIQMILETTGDHYRATHTIIQSLAKARLDIALDFALKLNTEDRRDKALLDIITSSLKVPVNKVDLRFVEGLWYRIKDEELRDKGTLAVIERFSNKDTSIESLMPQILQFVAPRIDIIQDVAVSRIDIIQDIVERCRAYCIAYSLLLECDHEKYASLASNLLRNLDTAWQAIDEGWYKIDTGFKIAGSLAKVSPEIAQAYIIKTETARDEIKINASDIAQAYKACLSLAIRTYGGLLPKGIAIQSDLDRLTQLIDRLPSNGDKAILWADLALRCYSNKKLEECRNIVAEHVRPLIENISSDTLGRRTDVIITTAPALYRAHPKTAMELISTLPKSRREVAYIHVIFFILRNVGLSDPYGDSERTVHHIDYEDILNICDLMELIEEDVIIHSFIISVVNSTIAAKKSQVNFTREQQRSIIFHLQQVVDKKLPNPMYIKHNGYKILSQAHILRLERGDTHQRWSDLIDDAHAIPNLWDRGFVLGTIASILPSEKFNRKHFLQEAREVADKIPVSLGRIKLYNALARAVEDVDISLFKEYLELAMQATLHQNDDSSLYDIQKDIVDLACQRDPDFGASLASSVDDDPTRGALNQRVQIFKTKERMVDQRVPHEEKKLSGIIYSQAAAKSLLALNSNRVNTVHIEHTREFMQAASVLPLSLAYPILTWVVENAVKRFGNSDQARAYLRPVYESLLLGAELAWRLATPYPVPVRSVQGTSIAASNTTGLVLQIGDREKAIQFLKDWFEYEVQEYLKIQDPYFGPEDLQFLKLLISVNPKCEVYVLTGLKNQEKTTKSLKDVYFEYWYGYISDQKPPDTEVVIVGSQQGIPPFHDRWLITKSGGLRLGTSLNSLGSKISEISRMSLEEASERERMLDTYLIYHKKDSFEGKLQYQTFTL